MGVQGANLAKTIGFYRFLETYLLGRVVLTRLRLSEFGRWRLPRRIPKGIQRWIPTGIQIPKEQDTGNCGLLLMVSHACGRKRPANFPDRVY